MSGKRQEILAEISLERDKQMAKWGKQDHPLPYWLAILAEEFGEAAKEIVDSPHQPTPNLRTELIQLAAVAVQMLEDLENQGQSGGTR